MSEEQAVPDFFQRQLAIYADYHRDPRNGLTHYVGIPAIFLAVLLPLSLWQITLGGYQLSLAVVLLVPAVIGWTALDLGIGLAMLAFIVPLVLAAEFVARAGGAPTAWTLAGVLFVIGWALQIVGHMAFEHRRPALIDNLFQMFIGPMFMTAKLVVGLGFRADLTAAMRGVPTPARPPRR